MRVPESVEQAHIIQLLRSIGGRVWELGTKRSKKDFYMGTRQSPGVPDLIVFLPKSKIYARRLLFIEVKGVGGRLRPEQRDFQTCCLDAGQDHLVGGLDDLIAWLIRGCYLKSTDVPHYRLPAARTSPEPPSGPPRVQNRS